MYIIFSWAGKMVFSVSPPLYTSVQGARVTMVQENRHCGEDVVEVKSAVCGGEDRSWEMDLKWATDYIEQSKNLCHKVIGKRGERVLRVVELREREFINHEGKVVMMDQDQEGFRAAQSRDQLRGKKRSPSRSPNLT